MYLYICIIYIVDENTHYKQHNISPTPPLTKYVRSRFSFMYTYTLKIWSIHIHTAHNTTTHGTTTPPSRRTSNFFFGFCYRIRTPPIRPRTACACARGENPRQQRSKFGCAAARHHQRLRASLRYIKRDSSLNIRSEVLLSYTVLKQVERTKNYL